MKEAYYFDLGDFEGPLDYLVYLIQKEEIDIYGVQLGKIVKQFLDLWKSTDVDGGAEFIGSAASLVYLKSRMLLPRQEQALLPEEEEGDPKFEIIHQLVEYCRFKQAAKDLTKREEQQSQYHFRGVGPEYELSKKMGIEHLSLEDVVNLFRTITARSSYQKGMIFEEEWRVSDKITFLRTQQGELPFEELLHARMCKEEIIVTFLAVLELMKTGELAVGRKPDQSVWIVFKLGENNGA